MKKITAALLAVLMVLSLSGCTETKNIFPVGEKKEAETVATDSSELKAGFLFPSDENAPDTLSRVEGIRKMQKEAGLTDSQILIKTGVKKTECEKKASDLAEAGCDIIFSTDPEFEEDLMEAARKYPDVAFCQEDGRKAENSGISNFHNYYTRLYEAYYVSGVVAGMKLNSMLNTGNLSASECVIGFAATKKGPEAISCINAFYLGVEKVCTQADMIVRYVDKTGNYDADGKCARQLIAAGAKLIGQYTSTTAVAAVCAENDIPLVGNNINLISIAPKEALTCALSDWSVYYTHAVHCIEKGKKIEKDWTGGYAQGANIISQLNDQYVADGTVEKVAEIEKRLRKGKEKVFDTEKFTIDETSLETLAKEKKKYKKYKKHIKDGNFCESMKKSAPIFDVLIDGITVSEKDYLAGTEKEDETSSELDEN
ncbi:MAG: BMP family ABC transporter substrate-binding protein [Eubacterium sp.]|nr:BMP family ABC transporter substrate-binding protein [Eubacterium sp.]MDD7209613.1 BMP family ABC transporter substrate-binding protein [Lachnospiraceae bacterium]MDY5497980.1 BMP family ABC transporter substrate-binding protein [Anaerobutyricum sp.]